MASTFDYENTAKDVLDTPTFEHLQGPHPPLPESNSDFSNIRLKLRGLMNTATFKGLT